MPLHLRFSHRMEPLLDGFDALLHTLWTFLESPPKVVVPSPSVARWLKLRLCERRGPLLGLETSTLEATLWNALQPEPSDCLLRVPALQQAILAVLDPKALERDEFHVVRAFLQPRGKPEPLREIQFSHEMARLFLEYEYNRPSVWNGAWSVAGLDRTWPERPYFATSPANPTESWQRVLHGMVFAKDGPLGTASVRHLGLPRLHSLRRDAGWTPPSDPLILFGIDKVSHFHRNLLLEIAREADVHLFLPNPCSTFWEDLNTSRRRNRGVRPQAGNLRFVRENEVDDWQSETLSARCRPNAASDPALLEKWGRTARENIALWCQAAEYDFEELDSLDPDPSTLLGTVQESLRQRHPGPRHTPLELASGATREGAMDDDGSILLLESPDRGREMETVRDQILTWLSEDSSRTLSDVVVLLPDPARHRVEIERVFGAFESWDPGHIPWTILGSPSSESLWARGVLALLELATGALDRPGVFAVLRNELCRRRLGVDESTVSMWERWSEGAGMIRGWDAAERMQEGPAETRHTFHSGLRRLLVAPLSGPEGVRLDGNNTPLPPWRDYDSSDPTLLEPFCAALERLHEDRERLRSPPSRPSDAARDLLTIVDGWLDVSAHPNEAVVRRTLGESLETLRLRDSRPLDSRGLTETVKGLLETELPGSSRAWTGSVTFAPLRPGNVLPHGLVIIPGLDADAFPGERASSALDLLSTRRIVGDPDIVSDNRHAFLLALLACRSRLVLSWRACDIQKDERKDPSSVVLELEEALRTGFVESLPRRRVRLLEREAPAAGELQTPSWIQPNANAADFAEVGIVAPDRTPDPRPRIPVRRLKQFLLDSWSHRIAKDLGVSEEERPDTMGASDSPLDSSNLLRANLRTELFPRLLHEAWNGADSSALSQIAASAHERTLWNADAPEGASALAERGDLEAWAVELHGLVAKLRAEFPAHHLEIGCDLGLSAPGAPSEVEIPLPDGRTAVMSSRIPAVVAGPSPSDPAILLCPAKPSSGGTAYKFRHRLEPLLWGLLASASGREVSIRMVPTVAGKGRLQRLDPPPRDALRSWLPAVLEDLLAGRCEYLPGGAITDGGIRNPDQLRESLEAATWTSGLEDLLDPDLPGESDGDDGILRALIERRLSPFLQGSTESVEEEDA